MPANGKQSCVVLIEVIIALCIEKGKAREQ